MATTTASHFIVLRNPTAIINHGNDVSPMPEYMRRCKESAMSTTTYRRWLSVQRSVLVLVVLQVGALAARADYPAIAVRIALNAVASQSSTQDRSLQPNGQVLAIGIDNYSATASVKNLKG